MDENKRAILDGLAALYPDAGPELQFTNPYETLVATILAAQCTDARVDIVTAVLFGKYPTAEAPAAADYDDVFSIVKPRGLGAILCVVYRIQKAGGI